MNIEETTETSENLFGKVRRHWRGDGSLAWAYWGFHFGGGLILLFVLAVSFLFLLPFAYSPDRPIQESPLFATYSLVAVCIYIAYVALSVVMVWRCGNHVQWLGWKYIARAVMLAWVARLFGYLVGILASQ